MGRWSDHTAGAAWARCYCAIGAEGPGPDELCSYGVFRWTGAGRLVSQQFEGSPRQSPHSSQQRFRDGEGLGGGEWGKAPSPSQGPGFVILTLSSHTRRLLETLTGNRAARGLVCVHTGFSRMTFAHRQSSKFRSHHHVTVRTNPARLEMTRS